MVKERQNNEYKPPPACPETAAHGIQEIPSSSASATISTEGASVAAVDIGNDEEREKENRNTDMENEKLKSNIDRFGAKRFMYSDSTFLAIYNFVKPKPGFVLNYYNGYTNKLKNPTYVNARGRQRNLLEIDELFYDLKETQTWTFGARSCREISFETKCGISDSLYLD